MCDHYSETSISYKIGTAITLLQVQMYSFFFYTHLASYPKAWILKKECVDVKSMLALIVHK